MALNDAIKFIRRFESDTDFRFSVYELSSPQEVELFKSEYGYSFEAWELEDAYTSTKLKCQSYEEADKLTEVYQCVCSLIY